MRIEAASDSELAAAERSMRQDSGDDREAQIREETAAGVAGAWLKIVAGELSDEITAIDLALARLGFEINGNDLVSQNPVHDARLTALIDLIEELLRNKDQWKDDERLVVFTEYKTTLDYLLRRLRTHFDDTCLLMLFGGMDELERDMVKRAFNDPAAPVRILLATDAAAEGLNLQRTARYMLHFDCPWNPSKLEQRNGRIDRHGQARDVTIHHFVSDQDDDLKFLAHVIAKANDIREDLGSANELFDEAAHRCLVQGESIATVQRELDTRVEMARGRASFDADKTALPDDATPSPLADLAATAAELDLDPTALRDTLEAALTIHAERPQLNCIDETRICGLKNPGLPGWSEVIDESLRQRTGTESRGPLLRLAFDPTPFLTQVGQREIFSPRPDVALMHLSHPMFQKALSALTRCRFPGTGESASRWTVRRGPVPEGAEALILFSLEELAVNDLRESFHHWVRTIVFPVRNGELGEALHHSSALSLRSVVSTKVSADQVPGRQLLEEVEHDLKRVIESHTAKLSSQLRQQLELDGEAARTREDERYRSRQAEVSSLIAESTMQKLIREIEQLKTERDQGQLFDEGARLESIDRSIEEKENELKRRKEHYEEVRGQLQRERERILKYLLPRRYTMSGEAQAFPVTIEVRLPDAVATGGAV